MSVFRQNAVIGLLVPIQGNNVTGDFEQWIVRGVIAVLMAIAGTMIWGWKTNWENKMIAQDDRLNDHEKIHAEQDKALSVLSTKIDSMGKTVDETHDDVKALLVQANGSRSKG